MENSMIITSKCAAGKYTLPTGLLLFVLLAILMLDTCVYQNIILTLNNYHNIYGDKMDTYRIDQIFEFSQQYKNWAYPINSILLIVSNAVIAFFVQLPLVFMFTEIRFRQLFRIALWAYIPLIFLDLAQTVYIMIHADSQLTIEMLQFVPLSLSGFMDVSQTPSHIYGFMGNFNLFQAAWCVIMTRGLYKTGQISKKDSFLVVIGMWAVFLAFQFLLINYLHKMFGA